MPMPKSGTPCLATLCGRWRGAGEGGKGATGAKRGDGRVHNLKVTADGP